MRFVADASPLVYVAKAEILDILFHTIGSVGVTPAVCQEAVEQGKKLGYRDAYLLQEAIEKEHLTLLQVTYEEARLSLALRTSSNLGAGECETISCAQTRGLTTLLHDRKARRLAVALGVPTLRLPNVLLLALIREVTTLTEFTRVIERTAIVMGMDAASLEEWKKMGEEVSWRRG